MISQKQIASVIEIMKLDDGTIVDSPERIHEGVAMDFQNFMSEHHERELPDLQNLISKEISMEENEILV